MKTMNMPNAKPSQTQIIPCQKKYATQTVCTSSSCSYKRTHTQYALSFSVWVLNFSTYTLLAYIRILLYVIRFSVWPRATTLTLNPAYINTGNQKIHTIRCIYVHILYIYRSEYFVYSIWAQQSTCERFMEDIIPENILLALNGVHTICVYTSAHIYDI